MVKRICLFDLSGAFRAAWHASEHEDISQAFNRTVSAVTTMTAGFDAVAICCDRPPYIRSQFAASYKAHREKQPAAMYEQLAAVEAQLDADGYHVIGSPGYEADDIIATITQWAVGAGHKVTIYSSDKDLLQLVSDRVTAVSIATRAEFGPEEVKAKMGVRPDQVHDLLALTGDASDNIAGIKGVGIKTAAAWINEIGDLKTILQNLDKLPLRFQEAVAAAKVELATSWKLTQLMTDAPINPEVIMETKEKKVTPISPAVEIPENDDRQEIVTQAPSEPTAIATTVVRSGNVPWERALEPMNTAQAWGAAQAIYKSRIFGDWPNAEAVFTIIMTGRAMGLDTVASVRSFHMIKGKACPSAHLLIALVQRSQHCEYFRMVGSDSTSATYETKRKGHPEPTVLTYTIEQANACGLLRPSKSGEPNQWEKRPDEMLRKTCAVQLARIVYPDVTMGLYSEEEMAA